MLETLYKEKDFVAFRLSLKSTTCTYIKTPRRMNDSFCCRLIAKVLCFYFNIECICTCKTYELNERYFACNTNVNGEQEFD